MRAAITRRRLLHGAAAVAAALAAGPSGSGPGDPGHAQDMNDALTGYSAPPLLAWPELAPAAG